MKKEIFPIRGYYLVEPFETGEKSKGGIYLPDVARKRIGSGKVLVAGKGKVSEYTMQELPVDIQEGDIVYFHDEYGGNEVEYQGKKLLRVRETEIFLIEREVEDKK